MNYADSAIGSNDDGILEPGFARDLRPMKYPVFFERFKEGVANTWTVEEISFGTDITDIKNKLTPAEKHVVSRLVAFFATGDGVVADNACMTLYKHVNSPEYRMFMSRQIYEEALHIQFYLTLLDNYVPDPEERAAMFHAIETIPSIKAKTDFCFRWMDDTKNIDQLVDDKDKQTFMMNLITFAAAVEGMFFMASFAYVYYLRSKGLLNGLADGTNWVFRDETLHMNTAFELLDIIKQEYRHLWTDEFQDRVRNMLEEAIECEMQFAQDTLELGVAGLNAKNMREYLEFCVDRRLERMGMDPVYNSANPYSFMELQNLKGHSNFFERTVSEYIRGVNASESDVVLDSDDF